MTKRLGLTVGAWTNDVLVHLGIRLPLDIWKVHWGHYYVDPALKDSIPQWYKFGKLQPDSWDEGLYYGFPPEGSEPVVKVSVQLADHPCSTSTWYELDRSPASLLVTVWLWMPWQRVSVC